MRFPLAVLALAASSVSASIIARQFPSCADSCLFGSNVNLDGCSATDNVCLCKSQTFVSTSTTCIEAACSGSDLQTALSLSQQLCAAVGVTLTSSAPAATHTTAKSSTEAAITVEESTTTAIPTTSTISSTKATTTSTAPSTSQTSSAASTSSSSSAPAAATTTNAAIANSINAFAGFAAIGLAALAL